MLTADSLNRANRRYLTWLYLALIPVIPLMMFNLSIARGFANFLEPFGTRIKAPVFGLALLAVWIAYLFGTILYVQRRIFPECPNCHKRITPNNVGLIIATKHCPTCGGLIIGQES